MSKPHIKRFQLSDGHWVWAGYRNRLSRSPVVAVESIRIFGEKPKLLAKLEGRKS